MRKEVQLLSEKLKVINTAKESNKILNFLVK
jgi:hypothetical protein